MDTDTKLDYRIAMEVMGWHLDDAGFWRDVAGKPKMSSGDVENYPDLRYTDWPAWSPTTNWADFGLVWGRFCEAHEYATLAIGPNKEIGFAAVVTTETGFICIKHAATRQEAACLAILGAWDA